MATERKQPSKRTLEIALDAIADRVQQMGSGEMFTSEADWREIEEEARAAAELKEAIERAS